MYDKILSIKLKYRVMINEEDIIMKVKVNGEVKEIKDAVTITEILKIENVEMPDMVSVQLNGEFAERDKFDTTVIKDNDEIEFLYFMGGGSIGF